MLPLTDIISNIIVFYSGGINSFFAAQRVIESYEKDKVRLVFTDTKQEDEDLYRFLVETSNYLDVPLTWLSEGRDVWQVMNDVRLLGNTKYDPCSRVLKRQYARSYIEKNFKWRNTLLVFGIDWSEDHRINSIRDHYFPYKCLFPLTQKPFNTYQYYFDRLLSMNISIPQLYKHGFTHNNCGGFCIKAGKAHFRRLLNNLPERYAYHEEQEQLLIKRLNKVGRIGILRHTVKGRKTYITLQQFREMEETEEEKEDVGNCGCFT